MGSVIDTVTDVVSWVGESISDVVEFAVDDVIKPVVEVATSVAGGMLDDPLTTIATIAAIATGQSWAIPLIQGASTAAQGGDIGDIVLAVGASYVGGKIGKYVGSAVTSQVGESAIGEIASGAASRATRNIITAAATGGDIAKAALAGAAQGGGSAAFNIAGDFIRDSTTPYSDEGIGFGEGVDEYFASEGFVENFNAATESVGIELADIVDTWDSIPEIGQDIIKSAAGATISSLAMTGQTPTDKQLASAITSAAIASNATASALSGQTGISDKAAAQITQIISDVSRTAYTGADPYKAYQASLSNTFKPELFAKFDELTEGGLDAAFDAIAGSATVYEEALKGAEQQALAADIAADSYNKIVAESIALSNGEVDIEGLGFYGLEQREQDRQTYQNSGGSAEGEEALKRLQQWDELYEATIEPLDDLRSSYDNEIALYDAEVIKVEAAQENLFTDQEFLDEAVQPIVGIVNKGFVEVLAPDFNETEYRELYNIAPGEDAYAHWLGTGRGNFVNKEKFDFAIDETIRTKLFPQLVGLEGVKYGPDQNDKRLEVEEGLVAAVRSVIGDDIEAARNLDLSGEEAAGEALGPSPILEAVNSYVNSLPDVEYTETYSETSSALLTKTPGTSDVDIASGKAKLVKLNKALEFATGASEATGGYAFTTSNFEVTPLQFDPKYNQEVRKIYSPTEDKYIVLGSDNKEIERLESGDVLPDGTVEGDSIYSAPLPPPPPNLQEVSKINGLAALNAASGLNLSNEDYGKLDYTDRVLVDMAMGVKNVTKAVLDVEVGIRKELGITGITGADEEIAANTFARNLQLNLGNIVEAGGELYKEWSGYVALLGKNPENLSANTAGKLIAGLGAATKPEDYKKMLALFNKEYRDNDPESDTYGEIIGEGILGKAESIALAMVDPRFTEVVLNDIIMKEVIQEVPTILASIATGGVAGAAVAGAKLGVKKLTKEAAEAAAKKAAKWTAVSTGAILSAGEEASSAAGQAFDELYTAAKEAGISDAEATKIAHNGALIQGSISAAITVPLSFMPGNPTKELISTAFSGTKRLGDLVTLLPKKTVKYAAGTAAEIAEEVTQEAGIQTFLLAQQIKEINPDASIFKPGGAFHDMDGALAHAGVYAAVASGGTSSILNAGNAAINAANADGNLKNIFDSYLIENIDPLTEEPPSAANTNTNNAGANALVVFNPIIHQATNDMRSPDPTVSAAGEATIKQTFGYDPTAPFDGTTIDLTQDPDGAFSFNTAVDILNSVNDSNYNTLSEVQAGFDNNTAGVPFVPTATDIQRFVGSAPVVTQAPDAPPVSNSDILLAGIDDYIDQNFTDAGEVTDYFTSLGYTPTQTEIDQFVGQTPETTQLTTIDPYVDPRQTTTDEVLDYFSSLGYTPDEAETALFTGQGAEDFQATQFESIDPYVDPRQVTRSEAEEFFATQNYTPTEEELIRFITQANDPTFQTTQEQALITEFDPLAVTEEEARAGFETAGFFDALPSDVERLTGQYTESDLTGRVQEALPIATYNSIADVLGKEGQEVTSNDIDFIADIIAQQEVLSEPMQYTPEQLIYDVNADNVVDIADQTMLEQVIAGTTPQTELAPTTPFAATGIQGQIQQQTQVQQQIQQQIQQQVQEQEQQKRQQRRNQEFQFAQQLLETSPGRVETPEPKSIDYVFDPFGESIFATPQQEALFVDPYTQRNRNAQGGIVSVLGGR